MIYVSRPEKVEAVQWTGENIGEVLALSSLVSYNHTTGTLQIGFNRVPVGNYVIRHSESFVYSMHPEDFHKSFRKPGVVHRDSKTGRFTSKAKTTENPEGTTTETT